MNSSSPRTYSLSVPEWRNLTLEGAHIPVRITLNGESMRPLIRKGRDHVTILPPIRPLMRGDVVLFADNAGRYVVHRIRSISADRVQTIGDNCPYPDAPLRHDQIWGIVTRFERNGREISLDTPAARAFGKLWMALLPVRKAYRRCRSLAGRCLRKLKGVRANAR